MKSRTNRAKIGDFQEAGLSPDEMSELAEEIRRIVMGDMGLALQDYVELAKKISHIKFGHRKLKALHNEPSLEIFFPDEVYTVLKEKGKDKQLVGFDKSDDIYFKNNAHRGIAWLSRRLYANPKTLYKRAALINVKIGLSLHHFTPQDDDFIKKNFSKGCRWMGRAMNSNEDSIRKRALLIGMKFEDNSHHYTKEDDEFIKLNRSMGSKWLSEQLKLNARSIMRRANRIGVSIKERKH